MPFLEIFLFALSSSTVFVFVFVFVPFHFIIIIIPQKPVYFQMRDRKEADPDGRGSGEKLGGEEG